jgi:hypothetical protein
MESKFRRFPPGNLPWSSLKNAVRLLGPRLFPNNNEMRKRIVVK